MPNIIQENPKITITFLAGALVTLTLWILSYWNITVSTERILAMTTVYGVLVGWLLRINKTSAKVLQLTTDEDKSNIIKAKENE